MDFDEAYRVTSGLTQDCGRKLNLRHLDQAATYAGLLEGTPNRSSNDWRIETDLEYATDYMFTIGKPYLIEPRRRGYLREPGDMEEFNKFKRRGPSEWLPLIRCIGCFHSLNTSRNPQKDGSALTIVWYQDDFAYPIDESILATIRSLDWDRLATDLEY